MTPNSDLQQNHSLGTGTKIQLVSKGQIVFGDSTDLKFMTNLEENNSLGFFFFVNHR